MELNEYYKVEDDCEGPMIFEDIADAVDYMKACLEGIDYEYPIKISKVQMTAKKYSELPEP
jgi:hypothetical protein